MRRAAGRAHLAIPIDLDDTDQMIKVASTSLNSKVVSQYSSSLAPFAVKAVMRIKDNYKDGNVDLRDIKIVKKLGGTLEDTELISGLCLPHRFVNDIGTKKVEKAKIGLIQFCISPPKTDMDNQVVISDYAQMDRVLKEERNYLLNIVKIKTHYVALSIGNLFEKAKIGLIQLCISPPKTDVDNQMVISG